MRFITRTVLFLAVNMAVITLLTIILKLFGLDRLFQDSTGINWIFILIFSFVMGFGGAFISLLISKPMAKRFLRVKIIKSPQNSTEAWIVRTVEDMARKSGIKTPEIGIYPSDDMNAFATGASRNSSLVAVSAGLIRNMNKEEVEAVLAHEIAHCANGDMITMTLLQGVLNTFVIFLARVIGFFVDKIIFRSERGIGLGYYITVFIAQIVLSLLASFITAAFSRRREYRADAGAAELAGAKHMIGALESLKKIHAPTQMPASMKSFGIRGDRGGMLALLLSTHPPLDDRIARLKLSGK